MNNRDLIKIYKLKGVREVLTPTDGLHAGTIRVIHPGYYVPEMPDSENASVFITVTAAYRMLSHSLRPIPSEWEKELRIREEQEHLRAINGERELLPMRRRREQQLALSRSLSPEQHTLQERFFMSAFRDPETLHRTDTTWIHAPYIASQIDTIQSLDALGLIERVGPRGDQFYRLSGEGRAYLKLLKRNQNP